jgi:hypothetical protein
VKYYLWLQKLKLITILFSLVIILCGCSSSYVVSPQAGADSLTYHEFNDKIREDRVEIELTNGRTMLENNIEIKNDSAKWYDASSGNSFGISVNQIKTVIKNDHWAAALQGFGYGAIGGGLLGYWAGDSTADAGWGKFTAALVVGTLGGILGGIGGLIVGHKDEYEFVNEEVSTKKREKSNYAETKKMILMK